MSSLCIAQHADHLLLSRCCNAICATLRPRCNVLHVQVRREGTHCPQLCSRTQHARGCRRSGACSLFVADAPRQRKPQPVLLFGNLRHLIHILLHGRRQRLQRLGTEAPQQLQRPATPNADRQPKARQSTWAVVRNWRHCSHAQIDPLAALQPKPDFRSGTDGLARSRQVPAAPALLRRGACEPQSLHAGMLLIDWMSVRTHVRPAMQCAPPRIVAGH